MNRLAILMFSSFALGVVGAHPQHDGGLEESVSVAAETPEVIGHGNLRYRVNRDWGKVPEGKALVTNSHAMVEDKEGQIYLVTDQMEHAFLVYEKDGTFVRSFCSELQGGHSIDLITLDGKEHLIHVDAGWHQTESGAWKFKSGNGAVTIVSKEGKIIRKLPSPHEIGIRDPKEIYKPCDVAVTPQGDILVVDGYASDQVFHFKPDGSLVRVWGGKKKDDPGSLDNAHGISIDDSDPNNPKVWVSSRNENRLKVFTLEGKYLETVDLPGAFAGQAFFRGDKIYTGVCWSRENGTGKKLGNSGFLLVLDRETKKVLSAPGGTAPVYVEGKLQPMHQTEKVFKHVHDLYVDSAGDVYVGEWNSGNRYPYKLELLKGED